MGSYSLEFTQLPPHPKQLINNISCNTTYIHTFVLLVYSHTTLTFFRYRFLLQRRWVNLRTVPLWSTMTSNLWTTWKCVHATLQCSAALRMTVLALKSWTHFSLSSKRSSPLPAGASEHWKNRDRWKASFLVLGSLCISYTPMSWLVFLLSKTDTYRLAGQKRRQKVSKIGERYRSFSFFSPFQTQKTEAWWKR